MLLSRNLCQTSQKVNYYEVLGLNSNASQKHVKIAYFRLAKKFHPDYNNSPNAQPMFEIISEAYEVLSDPDKRKNYDEYGTPGETFGGTTEGPQRKRGDNTYSSEDLFHKIFNQKGETILFMITANFYKCRMFQRALSISSKKTRFHRLKVMAPRKT